MELHLEAKVIGKGEKGRTACGSAAYRACDQIVDNAGNVHDYRHKSGYVVGGIELPEGAPEALLDRQTLWQRHESKDKRKDAELFREVNVAIPNEFDYQAAAAFMRNLAKPLIAKGMCVQWDIHDTTKDGQRNLHGHMMITMRTLNQDGTFGNKDRSWNKYNGGLNIADLLRPEAARLMNEELERIGSAERVEHESFAARGIDKIPTKHVGVAATAMERKGKPTKKAWDNKYIDFLNQIHAENLRQVEATRQGDKSVDELMNQAMAYKGSSEKFTDWDAIFAMLRDTRRCRAALRGELTKINKVISAYEEGNESYLRWAGCDPASETQRDTVYTLRDAIQINIHEMNATEAFLLDSKELFKAHNKAVYTAKKAAWDQYQIDRNKRGMAYCTRRLDSIRSYADCLLRSLSLFDILFKTQAYIDYCVIKAELQDQQDKLWAEYRQRKAAVKQAKQDLKEHTKEAKIARKDEKQNLKQVKRKARDDGAR